MCGKTMFNFRKGDHTFEPIFFLTFCLGYLVGLKKILYLPSKKLRNPVAKYTAHATTRLYIQNQTSTLRGSSDLLPYVNDTPA